MLVLSRKNEQAVVVGAPDLLDQLVRITVLEIGNGNVKLGFEADDGVMVHREEVWQRIRNSRPRDPPIVGVGQNGARNAGNLQRVLSGAGKRKSGVRSVAYKTP